MKSLALQPLWIDSLMLKGLVFAVKNLCYLLEIFNYLLEALCQQCSVDNCTITPDSVRKPR